MDEHYAYSTNDPDALAAWRATREAERTYNDRLRTDVAALDGAKDALQRNGIFGSRDELIALVPDDSGVIPEGWRIVRDRLEPRRGKPGEPARQWLVDRQPPDVRNVLTGHGLPRHSTVPGGSGYGMSSPVIFEHDGTLWACYNGKPGNILDRGEQCTWTPRKLSEYHAALEAVKAAEAASAVNA